MKKIAFLLLSLCMVAAGCNQKTPLATSDNVGSATVNSTDSQQGNNDFFDNINADTATWKTYTNDLLNLSFKYPAELGNVKQNESSNGYSHYFTFDKENQDYGFTTIRSFSADSIKKYNYDISSQNLDGYGPGELNKFPIEIAQAIVTTKPINYDCTKDFKLDANSNEVCTIVNINGAKVIRKIENGNPPNASDTSTIEYLFYNNNSWTSFEKTFYVYLFSNDASSFPNSMLSAKLNAQVPDKKIETELDIFNKMVHTIDKK
jgi:hypothetical protein